MHACFQYAALKRRFKIQVVVYFVKEAYGVGI